MYNKAIFYALLTTLFSCSGNDKLSKICPSKCYFGNKNTKNIGECKEGIPICDENFNIIKCEGEIVPTDEICDGKDQNCDGITDNRLGQTSSTWFNELFPEETNPCISVFGVCQYATVKCVDGSWQCLYLNGTELPNEVSCDSLDNDCDGQIDENLFQGQYCYSGPIGTEINPPCHPGALQCINGNVYCNNEKLPEIETCDGTDQNCDSIIDNTENAMNLKYDIVFIIDTSGSMCNEIYAVSGACSAYAQQFDGNINYRFALVIMTDSFYPYVRLIRNFSDFATVRNDLQQLNCFNSSPFEASLDSMLYVCDISTNSLQLSWREDSIKMTYIFTDESPQSYANPVTSIQDVISACLSSSVFPFIWAYDPMFQQITNSANGIYFNLSSIWQQIFNEMNSIIVAFCQ